MRRRWLRHRWGKLWDGIWLALGIGPIWVRTTCPACEREIEVEVD